MGARPKVADRAVGIVTEPLGQQGGRAGADWLALARRHRRGLLFLIAVVLAVVFVVENNKNVTTHFVFFTVTAKLWVALLVCLVLGALIGYLGVSAWNRRRQNRIQGQ